MDIANFLFPADLEATPTGLSSVFVIGSCLSTSYVKALEKIAPQVNTRHILFNNVAVLPEVDDAVLKQLDFQYIQLPLRNVLTDRIVQFSSFLDGGADELMEIGITRLRLFLDSAMQYNKSHGVLTFVSNFVVPQRPVVAALDHTGTDLDFCSLVRSMNQELLRLVRTYQNAYLADADAIGNAMGKRYFLDDSVAFYAHAAFWTASFKSYDIKPLYNAPAGGRIDPLPDLEELYGFKVDEMFAALWRQAQSMYRSVRQIDAVKLVIFDLDDTMWRGQIAEHYGDDAAYPVIHGWPIGLWEAVQHLRARGIITAICSKNDEALVRQRWSRAAKESWIKFDDFALHAVNWLPKAENVARLIEQANVTPRSVVFVDDNPVERESVRLALPGIRVIGDNPYATRRILLWSPETQPARRSSESGAREQTIRRIQVREQARSSMSREDFLQSLQCKIVLLRLHSQRHPEFERAVELLNKTNQFNTTGRRWRSSEIGDFLAEGGVIYAFRVEDSFTSYGLVGVLLYKQGKFFQFAMSCRVLGLGIETSVVNCVMRNERENSGQAVFFADIAETDTNMVSRDVFLRCGFAADGLLQKHAGNIDSPAVHLEIQWAQDDFITERAI